MKAPVNWWRAGALAVIGGALSVLVSSAPAQAQCVGDCNGDNMVAINELIIGVNIALGSAPISQCPSFDVNDNGEVGINELIIAVNNALTGCPPPGDTPTPTITVETDTPTPTPTGVPTGTTAVTCTLKEGTCSVTTSQACTGDFDCPGEETCELTGSKLNLTTAALPLNLVASGSLEIECGADGEDGTAACACRVGAFNPIVIPSIGDVCVNPNDTCQTGTLDCDGGTSTDAAVLGDHNIGECSSNAACATACESYCGALGANYAVLSSGCEGYCQGGENDEAACLQDTECPGGTCVGNNPPGHAGTCNCACRGMNLGDPSGAGDLTCQVGVQIDVELPSDTDCEDPNTIVLAPLCGAMTTTIATGQIIDANNTLGSLLPDPASELTGAAISCEAFRAGTVTDLSLVGHLAFFDSTLGDIFSANTFTCQ